VDDSSPQLDIDALTGAVRVALGRPGATVDSWQVEPLRGGLGAAIHRVSGVASQRGVRVPWSVIRKHVRDAGDSPADFSYWRREPLAYASGLLAELAGVAAPRCFAQSEDAGGVVLWLEDLADADGGGWAVERFGLVARGLGQLGGAHAGGRPVPDWPWLSQGWLASWVEQAAAGLEAFAEAVRDPLLARLYPPEVAAVMVELWQARGRICAILADWPQVLAHLDASPANVIVRDGQTYLIDWGFMGRAAPGEELAPLVAASGLFGGLPNEHLPAIDRAAFPAYLDGLRAAGWAGDPARVRFAYCATVALRYCVALTTWMVCGINPDGTSADVGGLRNPGQRALHETFFGRPFAEVQQELAAMFRFAATDLGREALEQLPRFSVS
jgi:hypothetical protein